MYTYSSFLREHGPRVHFFCIQKSDIQNWIEKVLSRFVVVGKGGICDIWTQQHAYIYNIIRLCPHHRIEGHATTTLPIPLLIPLLRRVDAPTKK